MKIFKQLEELGFFKWLDEEHNLADKRDLIPEYLNNLPITDIHITAINACALRWFRDKYKIHSWVTMELGYTLTFCWVISGENMGTQHKTLFKTYEGAELSCIIKLIELAKSGSLKA